MMDPLSWLSAAFLIAGLFFFSAGTLGLIRLPDPLSRLHALTKADNLGLGLVVAALLPLAPDAFYAAKLVLVWLLVLGAGATGAHLIAKRAVRDDLQEDDA